MSKKNSLIILGITALLCSRAMFYFFNDPEGPNLLIVVVAAAIVYGLSLKAYSYTSTSGQKKLLLAILVQIVIVTAAYFLLS